MRQMPTWERVLIVVGIFVAILLPILVFILNTPKLNTQLPVFLRYSGHQIVSPSYSAKSEVPGYTLTLTDTRYLDFVTETFGIFGMQAIVDPRVYHGFPDIKLRYTVSHIQLILVPTVDTPLALIPGRTTFIGRSDYQVDGDTLVVRVSLDFAELTKNPTGPNLFEDTFTRAALPAFYYAHGLSDGKTNSGTFDTIRRSIQDYLNNGLFGWPVKIETK